MNYGGMVGKATLSNKCLVAAVQAAAQINAQLAAEGKIPSQQLANYNNNANQRKEKKSKPGRKDLFLAEVEINDLPPRVRNLLTKGYIQEQIQWKSKAALCTKGRYIPKQEKSAVVDERPLYICIQAVDKKAVDHAILHIQNFISEHTGTTQSLPIVSQPPILNQPPPQIPLVKDKVYINLDHAPEAFKLIERVLGPSGDNFAYIQNETGVTVSLQGQHCSAPGSSEEPLHLLLEHTDANAVQNARSLALSLVGTLQQDFVQWQRSQQQLAQPQPQVLYTLTQPYYNGPQPTNFTYPAVAMVDSQLPLQTNSTKRPSRFDHQQSPGFQSMAEESQTKRPRMAPQGY